MRITLVVDLHNKIMKLFVKPFGAVEEYVFTGLFILNDCRFHSYYVQIKEIMILRLSNIIRSACVRDGCRFNFH